MPLNITGIDYLLKPVDEADLAKALAKYKSFEKHFNSDHSFLDGFRQRTRSRLMVKKGIENNCAEEQMISLLFIQKRN